MGLQQLASGYQRGAAGGSCQGSPLAESWPLPLPCRYLALDNRDSQLNALIAGLMMCTIANFCVILGAGFHSAPDDEDDDVKVRAEPQPAATTAAQAAV